MDNEAWKSLLRNKHFKVGLPFLTLVVVGSFGLREFATIRYDFRRQMPLDDEELLNKMKKRTVTLESEYEKIKKLDIDNWTNVRGPRIFKEEESE